MASHMKIPPRTTVDQNLWEKKGNENYFCSVLLGEIPLRVILYLAEGDPLGQLLLKRCRDADYDCYLLHQESQVIENLSEQPHRHQVVVLVDVMATTSLPGANQKYNNLEHISQSFRSNGLDKNVGLIGLLNDLESTKDVEQILKTGVSRLLTREESRGDRFLWELKMIENCEAVLREKQIFGLALYEAVDQSNDAIQITGKDSNIMYVNRAFLELSGYSIEEVIGQPAWDILQPYDSKIDNGPKGAVRKGQGWDGVCMGRRKSGGILKQHLKLIPVRNTDDYVHHHVTIQRLLSIHESDIPRLPSSPRVRPNDFPRQPSLSKIMPKLESPLTKAVQMLHAAKDNPTTPHDVRDILEKAIESLSTSELYTISTSGKSSGGIVTGLLMGGPRFPQTYTRTPQPNPHALPQNPPITPNPPEVQLALKSIDGWDFDIISMETISKSKPLYYCGMRIFSQFDVCNTLNIDVGVLSAWLKLMENHYHHQNPYHNSTHAADVLQATAYFVKLLQDNLVLQGEILENSEVASLLISAAVHDVDHPARTNPFLCNTRDELAILYNDTAVLENHHVAFCFKLTEQSNDVNIFQNLDTAAYRTMRKSIIELVLATDMAKHFEHLTKFENLHDTGSSTSLCGTVNAQNRMIMKKVLVKCADISNPCRPLPLCKEWAQRIAEEYFAQTEDEKQRKLPIVFPDFDRQTCRLPVTQVKFIDYFISGLFEAWNTFCPIPTLMDHLKANYEHWKSGCPDSPNYSEEEPDIMTNSS